LETFLTNRAQYLQFIRFHKIGRGICFPKKERAGAIAPALYIGVNGSTLSLRIETASYCSAMFIFGWMFVVCRASNMTNFVADMTVPILLQVVTGVPPGVQPAGMNKTPVESTE